MRIQRLIPMALAGVVALLAFAAASALAATPETVISAPTEVTATTAVFHGELNPNGKFAESYKWFFAAAPSTNSCTEEIDAPEPSGTALGNEKEVVEAKATGLQPNQNYTVCLATLNPFAFGPAVPFKTLPAAPVVVAGGTKAAAIGPFSATLEALVNPNNEETTYEFEYSTEESGGKLKGSIATIKDVEALPPEFGEREVRLNTGAVLEPEQIYFFHVTAKNATGTVEGPVEEFKTLEAKIPEVLSENVSALNSAEPKFEAQINPEYRATEYHFEYSKKETGGVLEAPITTVAGAPPLADLPGVFQEFGVLAGPVGVTDLQPGPTYFRVVATNGTGTAYGPVQEFKALAGPVVTTNIAGAPTRTAATVSGEVTPQGLLTTYHFAYVPQAQYEAGAANPYVNGKETHETKLANENEQSFIDYAAHSLELALEELAPETTYVYTLVARNELGTTFGAPQTFTTAAATPPVAATGAAQGVGALSATLTGSVDTRGLQTSVEFEFGATPYAGALLPAAVVPGSEAGTSEGVQAALSGDLQAGTTYYFRVLASNQDGVSDGSVQSFTTAGFAAAFAPATAIPFASYTSIGTLDANEAKEGKATNPVKKKKGKAKKRRRAARGNDKRKKK